MRGGKATKVPFDTRTLRPTDPNDPANWLSFEEALRRLDLVPVGGGVGFVFSSEDDLAGVDLDDCIDGRGVVNPAAMALIDRLGSYAEVSPSGTGVKVFLRGAKPPGARCKAKNVHGCGEVEVYDHGRYFTVTGDLVAGSPAEVRDADEALKRLCGDLWPGVRTLDLAATAQAGRGPRTSASEDDALLERMFAASNGPAVRALWGGDTSAHGGDDSRADMALCCHLAFWTGGDADRIDRMFRRSGLYREKWERRDYRDATIRNAIDLSARGGRPDGAHGARSRDSGPAPIPVGDANDDGGPVPLGEKDPASGRLVLSARRTLPTAEAYVREFHQHPDGRTLISLSGDLYEWRNNRYIEVSDAAVKSRLHTWMHSAWTYRRLREGGLEMTRFEANPRTVDAGLETIRSYVHAGDHGPSARWLAASAGMPPPSEILVCRSSSVHLPTGLIIPPTPLLMTTAALDFDYDPDPEPPERWIKFLEQLFGDDLESVELLQEFMGYCLLPDTSLQKALLIIGPRRAGKGTIARVLRALVGAGNVVAPTIGGLAGTFGLQPLLGKPLAIVSDARFSGEGVSVVCERLLCVIGEDAVTADRKYKTPVTAQLPTRFVILTNDLPRFPDSSSALAGRFKVLRLQKTFFDKEDTGLTAALMAELPGILAWAIAGWRRIMARGRFVQPAAGAELMEELEDLGSPVGAFVRECCVVGAGHRVGIEELYARWRWWCQQDGRSVATTKQSLGRDLISAVPGIRTKRGTGQVRFYDGLGLRGIDV